MKTPAVDLTAAASANGFHHEAMATTWEIRLPSGEPGYARHAATEAFREIDRLERLLSRFLEGGEIWCVNHLRPGEQLRISGETHACLIRAMRMQEITGGAFHPGLGAVMDRVRSGEDWEQPLHHLDHGCLVVDGENPVVACDEEGFQLDLGAIGKGFALDCVRTLLEEWGFSAMLLSAGGSSILATGQDWEIRLRGDSIRPLVSLRDLAVGSSGSSVQGRHIIDVRRGTRETLHLRSWAICASAADADALSTAALDMDAGEIEQTLALLEAPCLILLETFEGNRIVRRQFSNNEGLTQDTGLSA